MKITLENLIFEGIHGVTEKEKNNPQKFRIDVSFETRFLPIQNKLEKLVDYREIKKIVQEIIEGKHCELIEVLTNRIVDKIMDNKKIMTVTVTLQKIEVWNNGTPGVTITRHAIPSLDLLDFDCDYVIEELLHRGGVSFPILPEKRRLELLKEAEGYNYIKQPEVVGPAKVKEQLSSFDKFPLNSLFFKLRDDFTELLNYKLSLATVRPFNTLISFNELVLQKYEKGSIGITPHVDGLSYINLVIILILKGGGDFVICDNRDGSNPYYLDKTPGNAIILRAPGFFGSNKRPFHYLADITRERITFGLRQKIN